MARKHLIPTCRYCGKKAAKAKCSKCGRLKCEDCTPGPPGRRDCGDCRLEVYTPFAGKKILLCIEDNNNLSSLCGPVAKSTSIYIHYFYPEAVEEAGQRKYELERKGYWNITLTGD